MKIYKISIYLFYISEVYGLAIICAVIVFFLPIYQEYKKQREWCGEAKIKFCVFVRETFFCPLYDWIWPVMQIPYRMVKRDA